MTIGIVLYFLISNTIYSDGMVDDAYRGEELRFGE